MPVESADTAPIWAPRMTVSALIERDGRYLVVEEVIQGQHVLNQPAGHLEPGESVIEAVIREVREETCRQFKPRCLTGLYRWQAPSGGPTFMRVNFCGEVGEEDLNLQRDNDISGTHWVERAALAVPGACRSPLVLRCVDDYLAGRHYPLDVLHELD